MGVNNPTSDASFKSGTTWGKVSSVEYREVREWREGESLGPPEAAESEVVPEERTLGVVSGERLGLFRGEKTLNDVVAMAALTTGEEELAGTEPVWLGNDRGPGVTDRGRGLTDKGPGLTDRGPGVTDREPGLTDRGPEEGTDNNAVTEMNLAGMELTREGNSWKLVSMEPSVVKVEPTVRGPDEVVNRDSEGIHEGTEPASWVLVEDKVVPSEGV